MNIFSSESENYDMLFGAYKKIKSYYYYNKNFLYVREKIARFEHNTNEMESTLRLLARVIKNPSRHSDKIKKWIDSINYYVLPKTFSEDSSVEERFVSSTIPSKSVTKVNFFIDMPIELHLIETLWTLFVARIASFNSTIQNCSYGNAIDEDVLFDKNSDELKSSIRFEKNNLFKIYFQQYGKWKNNAIDCVERHKNTNNMAMISLDIKSFYYSVRWQFGMLKRILPDGRLDEIAGLTGVVKKIFERYTIQIREVRELRQNEKKKEFVLPIGLFSSMLIANLYISSFDCEMKRRKNVLYYGRYVDDILLIINVDEMKMPIVNDLELESLLITNNSILAKSDNNYHLFGNKDMLVQKEKMKVICFEQGKSEGIISQIRKTRFVPSQMNIIPNKDLQMVDFEEAAYALHNFTNETKIRDLGHLVIDRFKLSSHMADLVRYSRHNSSNMSSEDIETTKEELSRVVNFFVGSDAIEFCANWINALYFILLSEKNKKTNWNNFEDNIRNAIKSITIHQLEEIKRGKTNKTKSKMKKDLSHLFDICIATALAINPNYSRKEHKDILDLCLKLRSSNMFNHYLVSFPLMNYSDAIESDIDLSNMTLVSLKKQYFQIEKGRKITVSPRFINFDELFQYSFIRSIVLENSPMITNETIEDIQLFFVMINQINKQWAKPLPISIQDENGLPDGYKLQKISLNNKDRDLERIKIAVANIKLDIDSACMGLNGRTVQRNRLDFITFLNASFISQEDKVDYLVFPEYYMPIEWMPDVLSFVRKTGITVISGIQYICSKKDEAHNNIAVFARTMSGKYSSSCVFLREKNNYAPLEKQLVATEGYIVKDNRNPIYTYFDDGLLKFGLLLCYEFTDIIARSLYKNRTDIIFIPEYNKDTSYFSSIIESMTRDTHAFMVQSNTSLYGDSRISGPYGRDYRNVVQIKGGDNDSLIIGTINVQEVREYRIKAREEQDKEIQKILKMDKNQKKGRRAELITEQNRKIEKISANTFF